MSGLPQLTEPPIVPLYFQDAPNEPLQLGSIGVQFEHDDESYSETANAVLRFLPKDRLSFVVPTDDDAPSRGLGLAFDGWQGELRLGASGVKVKAMCGAVGRKYGGINLLPMTSGVTITPPCDSIVKVTFHVFNFPDFKGPDDYVLLSGDPPRQGARGCGRTILRADGWTIEITELRKTDELVKGLKDQGGFVITHVGGIVRDDGATFTSTQLDDLLQCLQCFLSFALGRWAGLALAVGFDANGDRVFEEWGMRMTAEGHWHGSCAWFDSHHGELLSQVFPGFIALWKSQLWHQPLTEALYWYLAANDRGTGIGVDAGLILAQTAVELLAWNYCVKELRMVSEAAFKQRGLSAADKLRLLASATGIPKDIPPQLKALHSKPGAPWSDAMHAITDIRNSLVHPDTASRPRDNTYYDAWRLSLWFIDLVLLRLCDHSGKYSNRLVTRWVGTVELVPWA